ncbi:MAG: hypothetical protein RIM33_08620 [Alphaproteobacteria bacterium]
MSEMVPASKTKALVSKTYQGITGLADGYTGLCLKGALAVGAALLGFPVVETMMLGADPTLAAVPHAVVGASTVTLSLGCDFLAKQNDKYKPVPREVFDAQALDMVKKSTELSAAVSTDIEKMKDTIKRQGNEIAEIRKLVHEQLSRLRLVGTAAATGASVMLTYAPQYSL